jgi:molybdenum cofactor biosynthesis enzyme MoaA
MTGLGALRCLRAEGVAVAGFIDSDPAFKDKYVSSLPVFLPNDLPRLSSDNVILIAVSLKEDEIRQQLAHTHNISTSLYSFQDQRIPYYTIDILGSCNLRCGSCPHGGDTGDTPKGSMSFSEYKLVLDKIMHESPGTTHLSLYSWGEPLLHPKIEEIVSYAHTYNLAVALSTNLSIKFDKRIDSLIQASPDYLKISVSGYYPNAYNATHQGGDVNLVKSNLYRIRHAIDKYDSKTLVDINYHLYRDNSGRNLEKFEELADELGFVLSKTYALVMPLERVIKRLQGQADPALDTLEDNMLVTIEEGLEASRLNRLPGGVCPFRENQVNINSDLTVPVCCTTFDRKDTLVAKNFLHTSLKEITEQKAKITLCTQCMELGLPEYNMGFNRAGWAEFAQKKQIVDRGLSPPRRTIKLQSSDP